MPVIKGYHAHVYYDAATKPLAAQLRDQIEQNFSVQLGRWHDKPVGPHPCGSYQIAFAPESFGELIPWLAVHRGELVVFVHPQTGDDLADHRDYAIWMGGMPALDLDALG